ncbi:hypothetical protein AT945_04055 [Campylobacter jejuni]|nr:hypothetical protein [Campylobacter jejuni]
MGSYPTLAELSNSLKKERDFINENEEIYEDNLEQLLTYLITPLPFKTKEDILRDEASYIEKIDKINNYFMELRGNTTIDRNNNDIVILSQYINENRCTCITLNYDLLLEEMLFLTKKYESYDVFYKIPIKQINERKKTKSIGFNFYQSNSNKEINKSPEIIKLHGSINWYCDQVYQNSQIYSYSAYKEGMYYNIERYSDELFIDLKPLIIPPILDKTNNYNHILLQSLWRKAFRAIRNAKNIYIYGFSFPMTDLSVVYLFQSALRLNKNDYKIYIVNTESNIENKKKRYNEIFSEGKCDFSFCRSDNLEKLTEHLKKIPENI